MAFPISLEDLKEVLDPDRMEMRCALVLDLEVAKDRSVLRVDVSILPEQQKITAKMSWDMVGPDSGLFQFPSKNDLVLVAFCEDDENDAYIMKRLTSREDKIPVQAVNGHMVIRSRNGTKTFIGSDQTIHLTNLEEGTENLVLGQVFKTAYSEHLDIDSTHDHLGNFGYNTSIPNQSADYIAIKNKSSR